MSGVVAGAGRAWITSFKGSLTIARAFADARVTRIYGGTNEIIARGMGLG